MIARVIRILGPKHFQELLSMFALFISLEQNPPRSAFEDIVDTSGAGVVLFDLEVEAVLFAVSRLVKAGLLQLVAGGYLWCEDGQPAGATAAEALDSYHENLGGSEYLHVYKVHERPYV
ncbi:MAG: hypothetical protein AB7V46_16800, partial [Thermomicrobiales bacterium]